MGDSVTFEGPVFSIAKTLLDAIFWPSLDRLVETEELPGIVVVLDDGDTDVFVDKLELVCPDVVGDPVEPVKLLVPYEPSAGLDCVGVGVEIVVVGEIVPCVDGDSYKPVELENDGDDDVELLDEYELDGLEELVGVELDKEELDGVEEAEVSV